MHKIKVGVAGGAGYTGGELLRLLLEHPAVELSYVESKSHAGQPFSKAHPDLWTAKGTFVSEGLEDVDVLFLCLGHGQSKPYLEQKGLSLGTKVIDLSQDFRLAGPHDFIYGLPELNRERLEGAQRIANPGCFATAILLSFFPLAKAGVLDKTLHVTGVTGSTGAGQAPSATTHFSWRSNNLSVYKAFTHQHLAEIQETLAFCGKPQDSVMNWVPIRGSFTRGILISAYQDTSLSLGEVRDIYEEAFEAHPFTTLVDEAPDLKFVVNTNQCFVHVDVIDGKVHIVSVLDNLLKGASGQALQNMNIACGIPEDMGLRLKASAF